MTKEETAMQDIKDFYDFASYHIAEGIDMSHGMLETIKTLVIDYVDHCKNSGHDLPTSFDDDVDYWHVAEIIRSQLSLDVDYYKAKLDTARKAIAILKDL